MRRASILALVCCCICFTGFAQKKKKKKKEEPVATAVADTTKKTSEKKGIEDKVKSSKKTEGLFVLYQDTATGSVQLYVKKEQLNNEFIYQSFSLSGPTSLYLNQNMIRSTFLFSIKKSFDRIEFVQENTRFYYDSTNPVSKAANVDVVSGAFLSEKIVAEDSLGYLIAGDGLFLSEKMDPVKPVVPPALANLVFNLGNLNSSKSKYKQIRSYPENTDVIVELAFDNAAPQNRGGDDITDARYNTVALQHSFLALPKNKYTARKDDPRVGYFGAKVTDLTSHSPTPYKDFISRWHLEKKDPSAAISEPVEPIVFWIENTTPYEYRDIVKDAGERWNEAFEKAGFKNAVVMKMMPDTATWDPSDIRYNVIRWVSSPNPPYGAIGPSFFNPRTGQILGADITIEWRSGSGSPYLQDLYNMPNEQPHLSFATQHLHTCTIAHELQMQYQYGLTAIEVLDGSRAAVSEMHHQFLIYLIMHEMGHTLGLNHNMKASQMLSPTQINDTSITRKIGMIGSVMDYPMVNISSNRSKQGDYYTTKAGPYDLWAIEYGYTPYSSITEEEEGLQKILNRSTDPQLIFGNDADDMRSPGKAIDPRVMVNDLTNDMFTYGEDRYKLVNTVIPKLTQKYGDGTGNQSYQLLRTAYNTLISQRMQVTNALSRYVGGVYVDRSFTNQKSDTKPFTPVPAAKQKQALALINKYVFAPSAFAGDAQLYPYLQVQRRGFDFFSSTEDYKPQGPVSAIQRGALAHILHPVTLARVNNTTLYGNTYTAADILNDLNGYIFRDDLNGNVNLFRINLQTEYVKQLATIISETPGNTYENASKAAAYSALRKIKSLLSGASSPNETTRAHRQHLLFQIDNVLKINK